MDAAGLLLTGGSSRRMGRDKASIRLVDTEPTLAERTAALVECVVDRCIEVGPGYTHLRAVKEAPPGHGPLSAVAAGWQALCLTGRPDAVLVVATDLPFLTGGLLSWLVAHPHPGSVVPEEAGRVQPLCARYSRADLERACNLVRDGYRAMNDLLQATRAYVAPEPEWLPMAGSLHALDDIDTPADLERAARLWGDQ
jgi:molybdopterin-guanine dinucleotide biosynthesis protein A